MTGFNKVILVGYVGRDPVMHPLMNGKVAKFSVATTFKSAGNAQTEWHNIHAFDKLADLAEKYIKKGSPLCVEGRIKTEKYTNKDGRPVENKVIVAQGIQLLGSKSDTPSVEKDLLAGSGEAPSWSPSPVDTITDDDIPF